MGEAEELRPLGRGLWDPGSWEGEQEDDELVPPLKAAHSEPVRASHADCKHSEGAVAMGLKKPRKTWKVPEMDPNWEIGEVPSTHTLEHRCHDSCAD